MPACACLYGPGLLQLEHEVMRDGSLYVDSKHVIAFALIPSHSLGLLRWYVIDTKCAPYTVYEWAAECVHSGSVCAARSPPVDAVGGVSLASLTHDAQVCAQVRATWSGSRLVVSSASPVTSSGSLVRFVHVRLGGLPLHWLYTLPVSLASSLLCVSSSLRLAFSSEPRGSAVAT